MIALVLFVKDESYDILWWISWHLSLGIDHIFIYDDNSSDGTQILVRALADQDRRISVHTTGTENHFSKRQAFSYIDALTRSQGVYEWVGFLDSDEYLDLIEFPNISSFLSKFSSYNGVVLNWKCYGSDNHLLKPSPNVFDNYFSYIKPERGENFAVKSFIRPEKTKLHYLNPHVFLIDGSYANSRGQSASLDGFMQHPVIWDAPFIRHYITRSLENYLEKLKRREDLRENFKNLDFFNSFNRDTLRETPSSSKNPNFVLELNRSFSALAAYSLKNYSTHFFKSTSDRSIPFSKTCNFFQCFTSDNSTIYYKRDSGVAFSTKEDVSGANYGRLQVASSVKRPDIIYLYTEKENEFLNISGIPEVTRFLSFYKTICSKTNNVYLVSSSNKKILSCTRYEQNLLCCDRIHADAWEFLNLRPIEKNIEKNINSIFFDEMYDFTLPNKGSEQLFFAWKTALDQNESNKNIYSWENLMCFDNIPYRLN